MAQAAHIFGGPLAVAGRTSRTGAWPRCAIIRPAFSATTTTIRSSGSSTRGKGNDYYRASVARGADIFMFRQFWLRDAAHINSIGLGNPLKRTCATCHNAQMTGQDLSAGWVDVGTTNYPTWTEPSTWAESSELPVFKITCSRDADPHPYLGRVIYTTDPGRALISGRCVGCRLDRDAAAARTGRASALLRERLGQDPARGRRFLRSPLRHETHRTRRRKTSSTSWGLCSAAAGKCGLGLLHDLAAVVALGQQRNFVSCPIVRDTKTVPCFLAEYDGELYYLGIQQDITSEFHPPQLKHEVLVEGRVAEVRACAAAFRFSRSPSRF